MKNVYCAKCGGILSAENGNCPQCGAIVVPDAGVENGDSQPVEDRRNRCVIYIGSAIVLVVFLVGVYCFFVRKDNVNVPTEVKKVEASCCDSIYDINNFKISWKNE